MKVNTHGTVFGNLLGQTNSYFFRRYLDVFSKSPINHTATDNTYSVPRDVLFSVAISHYLKLGNSSKRRP